MNRPASDPPSLGSGFLVPISILLLCDSAAITSLKNGRWSKITGRVEESLHQLNAMFESRFEKES